ncbi:hypothetical protein NFI96_007415, partial [Prochilodus magdalenae]
QVTNATIIPAPANMFLPDSRPAVPLPRFSRHLNPSEQGEGAGTGGAYLRLGNNYQDPEETYLEKADRLHALMCAVTDKSVFGDGENTKVRVSELEEEGIRAFHACPLHVVGMEVFQDSQLEIPGLNQRRLYWSLGAALHYTNVSTLFCEAGFVPHPSC